MKREIVLKDGAPPLEDLRAVLRVDIPYKFDPKNFNLDEAEFYIGRKPENLLDAVNEEMLMLAEGTSDVFEILTSAERGDGEGDSPVTEEWVLVDGDNTIWSEYVETVTSEDL